MSGRHALTDDDLREVAALILAHEAARPYPPSIAEMEAATHLSCGGVRHRLMRMRERGFVVWTDGCSRTLRLTAAGAQFAQQQERTTAA